MEYSPNVGHEVCLWKDCRYVNKLDVDLDEQFERYIRIHGTSFPEFVKTLKQKKEIGI